MNSFPSSQSNKESAKQNYSHLICPTTCTSSTCPRVRAEAYLQRTCSKKWKTKSSLRRSQRMAVSRESPKKSNSTLTIHILSSLSSLAQTSTSGKYYCSVLKKHPMKTDCFCSMCSFQETILSKHHKFVSSLPSTTAT